MNILITGSNGYVGSHLMYFLEENSCQVFGIDKSTFCNINPHPATIIGDIRNIDDLRQFSHKNIEIIIHCAADKHDYGISAESYFSNNEFGTKIIAQFASENDINNILYYSTVSVYGHQPHPCDESAEFLSDTVYGDSKLAGEKVLWEWQKKAPQHSLITLRPSVIYGKHNFANMYNLINQMHKFPWFMVGNGNHIKSMVALENMVDMTWFILDKFTPGIQNFNCIDKPYLTVRQLMESIAANPGFTLPKLIIPFNLAVAIGKIFDIFGKIIKRDLPINSDRMKKFGTATDYRAEKIRQLGYLQRYSINIVFQETCQWYLNNLSDKSNKHI